MGEPLRLIWIVISGLTESSRILVDQMGFCNFQLLPSLSTYQLLIYYACILNFYFKLVLGGSSEGADTKRCKYDRS